MSQPSLAKRQRGASLIAAIFLLLLFAALAAYMLWFGSIQQRSTALDVTGARALQAARSGIEWGAHRLLRNHGCAASTAFSLAGSTLSDFNVNVTCVRTVDTDQLGTAVRLYRIEATACNAATCPSASPGEAYAERVIGVLLSCPDAGCP